MAVISVVVAARDLSKEREIAANLKGCGAELVIVEGRNPSLQRNEGVRLSKGDIIYFADNDSVITRDVFMKAELLLENDPSIAVLGGPSLTPDSDTPLQKSFGAVFASPWAAGKSSARYRRSGSRRVSGEKELILCNMFIRKEVFEKLGGFREDLYPNEENDFMNRAQRSGCKAVYDPDIYVTRSQRRTYPAFIRQCFTYGRGRAEQMLAGFDKNDAINTVPAFFVFYLLYLAVAGPAFEEIIPLLMYAAGCIAFALRESSSAGGLKAVPLLLVNFPVMHLTYGIGFLFGLFRGMVVRDKKIDRKIQAKIISN
jgi:cellulose synthase/poly-beta-1,6-N-acetylglucosamine synthase-like glycosyltransferase